MKKHYDIRVFGLVQGVWFRKNTKIQADRMGINGFVRNSPDGSVIIEAEGPEEPLDAFLEWCRKGPSGASVRNVETQVSGMKNFDSFMIEY